MESVTFTRIAPIAQKRPIFAILFGKGTLPLPEKDNAKSCLHMGLKIIQLLQ